MRVNRGITNIDTVIYGETVKIKGNDLAGVSACTLRELGGAETEGRSVNVHKIVLSAFKAGYGRS